MPLRHRQQTHPKISMIWRTRLLILLLCFGLCFTAAPAGAQDTDAALPDSPSHTAASADPNDSPTQRETTWRSLPGDFLHDQKGIWTFPGQLAKGHHWAPTVAITGITAGLIFGDPHAMPYFRHHARNLDDINDVFDAPITTGEVIAVPASLMALRPPSASPA